MDGSGGTSVGRETLAGIFAAVAFCISLAWAFVLLIGSTLPWGPNAIVNAETEHSQQMLRVAAVLTIAAGVAALCALVRFVVRGRAGAIASGALVILTAASLQLTFYAVEKFEWPDIVRATLAAGLIAVTYRRRTRTN